MKLSTAQAWGPFQNGEASHISEFRTQTEASSGPCGEIVGRNSSFEKVPSLTSQDLYRENKPEEKTADLGGVVDVVEPDGREVARAQQTPRQLRCLSLSHTHTHTHSLLHSLTLTRAHTHMHSLSLSHTHTHTHKHTLYLSLSCFTRDQSKRDQGKTLVG